MASELGWIDISPKDRNRVKRFMDLMGMSGVMDELGVGVIRDAMSNKIFPGFSTLYTRAKYFFITPYILYDIEKDVKYDIEKDVKEKRAKEFHNREVNTNSLIKYYYEQNKIDESYFGKYTAGGELKRQPSEIYWNGITTIKLIDTESSLQQLLRTKKSDVKELLSCDCGDGITQESGENHDSLLSRIPCYKDDWQNTISGHGLRLTVGEADILKERFNANIPHSLPAALVENKELWGLYKDASEQNDKPAHAKSRFVLFVERLRNSKVGIEDQELRENLFKAHDLSLMLHGLHIAYNIKLWSSVTDCNDDFVNKLKEEGREWFKNLKNNGNPGSLIYENFNIEDCMNGVNVKGYTRTFLENAHSVISNGSCWDCIEQNLCQLVYDQECNNKKSKSRFVKIRKQQAIKELQGKPEWVGLGLISYRYDAALSVIEDIYNPIQD